MAEPLRNTPADWESEPPSSPGADPFPYGWRIRHVRLPSGEVAEQQIPLTPEDLLDPQLGDVVVQSEKHFWDSSRLADLLDRHFAARLDACVTSDLKMRWGIPKLPEPAPDIAVIFGVREKVADRDSFDCVREGTRPSLVIEVASSKDAEVRRNDYERKPEIYEKAEIPEYLIIEPSGSARSPRCVLTGYRLGADRKFRSIEPDSEGFLYSETTRLRFGVDEEGCDVRVIDAVTGKRLLYSTEVEEALNAAEAEIARLRAELERYRGQ